MRHTAGTRRRSHCATAQFAVSCKDVMRRLTDADVVYPKSWAPAHVMRERTRLLRGGEREQLARLESEALANNAKYKAWECDTAKMQSTRGGRALYMHCLPADVSGVNCAEGEVSKDVFERARFDTYREAGYKPFVIAAMILGTRFATPALALERVLASGTSAVS